MDEEGAVTNSQEPRRLRARAAACLVAAMLSLSAGLVVTGNATGASPSPQPLALINVTQFADTQYLIVTASPFAPAMQSIADWKTQKGLPAEVALISDVYQSYTGRDDAEKLHHFLQDVYFNATNGSLKYVVLGGGVDIIPIRYLQTNGSIITWYTHDYVFSDVYYAGLDSSWGPDANGNYGFYGTEDWDANVIVGRLPFNDIGQAAIMRDNLLSYERAPLVGTWMRQAVAFASVMDPPNRVNVPGDPYEYAWWEDNAIRSVWNTQGYLPAQMNLDILADYYEIVGGNYTQAQDRLSNTSMMAAMNNGASVVMSVTHGWVPSGRGVPEYSGADGSSYSWGLGLTYLNATDFTNLGTLSAGYFSSCLVGNFSDPTLPNLARFLLQNNRGFVAMVLPTDGTLRGEDDFDTLGIREGNWWQSENFWRNFFEGEDPYRMGPALYQTIRDYDQQIRDVYRNEWSGHYRTQKAVYNLLGDPEVPIWTDVAASFDTALPPEGYTAQHHFRATYLDGLGRPVAGATVAIQGPGVYTVVTTDAQGRIDAVIAPNGTGTLTVTATAHNFLPRVDTIPVVPAPPDLSLERDDVVMPSPSLRAGTTVTIGVTVHNLGQQASPPANFTAEDIAPGSFPEIVGGVQTVPALSPGASAALSFDWTPTGDGVHTLRLTVDGDGLVAEFDELNNQVSILVPVASVDLFLDGAALTYDPPAEVSPGGLLRVTGTLGRVGQVPRGYLIGYTLTDERGVLVHAANLPASTAQDSFALQLQIPQAGNYTLDITLDLEDVILEFNESNNAVARAVRSGAGPSVYAMPPLEVVEGSGPTALLTDLRAFVADPDTPFESLEFHASADTPSLQVWVEGSVLYGMPAPGFAGTGTITLVVSDGRLEAQGATVFRVVAVNDAPVFDPLPVFEVRVGETFTYPLTATDPDGDALIFATQTTTARVNRTTGVVTVTPGVALVGTHTLSFTVSDGSETVQRDTTLVVRPANAPPEVIDMGPVAVTRGEALSYTLLARDPDGDPVLFSGATGSLRVDAQGRLNLSAPATQALAPGTYFIVVYASDGIDESNRTVTLVVSDPGAAPAGPSAGWETSAPAMAAAAVALGAAGVGLGLTMGRRRRPDA